MQRLRLLLTVSILVMLLASVSTALAQDGDGDGLPDSQDNCPDQAGPRENGGCPEDGGGDEYRGPWDGDEDGLTDDVDFCPSEPGPAENGGCPLPPEEVDDTQPDVELTPLPAIPPGEPCQVATQGYTPVNIRHMPWTTSPAVGAMDPFTLYPLNYFFDNPDGELWYGISGGHVASWVTRINGLCRGLPTYSFAEPDDDTTLALVGDNEITLKTSSPLAGSLPDDWTLEPEFEFPPGNWPFPDPPPLELHEHVLLAGFEPGLVNPEAILIGLLLPAVQKAREAATDTGETQHVVLTVPGTLVGFNPQPEPPAVVVPGDLVGFNPQPEPPPGPYFQVLIKIEPNTAEENGQTIPMEIFSLNFGEINVEACDSSTMPTEEMACLYTSEMGDSAVCMQGADEGVFCMYGANALPAMQ